MTPGGNQNRRAAGRLMKYLTRMSGGREIRNIALIGFMGSGKSSVGRLVADMLQFRFVDTDELIESRAHKKISDIFAQEGEEAFRARETELLAELCRWRDSVFATGGGLPTRQANLDSLRKHAWVVCLWATPEKIFERVQHQTHRPLLKVPEPLARIRELIEVRTPYYRQADMLVTTDGRAVREVALKVIAQFRAVRHSSK